MKAHLRCQVHGPLYTAGARVTVDLACDMSVETGQWTAVLQDLAQLTRMTTHLTALRNLT